MNDIQRKLTYNTCLICGIRTSQLVNIFEEGRGGPNLVDVIYEKYNIKVSVCRVVCLKSFKLIKIQYFRLKMTQKSFCATVVITGS